MVTMFLAFILVILIDGATHETAGVAAFRDITRCKFFAKEIAAYCVPRFLPKDTKFWD